LSSVQKNFIYNALLSLSQVVFPLITFPYVARVILPSGIGQVAFVESICRYAILFAALGIPIYGVREVAKLKNEGDKLNKLFTELIVIHFVITIVILGLFLMIIFFIPALYDNIEFYLFGAMWVLSNVFMVEWYFQGIGKFRFITVRNVIIKTIFTILIFFVIKEKDDVVIYFFLLVLTLIVNAVVNFINAFRNISFDFTVSLNSLKRHFKPLLFIFSSIAFISIYTLMDTIMLGFMTDEKAVGFYSTGLKVSRIPMMFVGALGVVLIPKLSEHFHSGNDEEFKRLINKSINFVITSSVPIAFVLFSLSDSIIITFAGIDFIESGTVLQILSVLSLLIGLSNVFGLQVLTPMGKDKYLTYSVLIGMIISLSLNFILIPIYKEIGAAFSNVVAEIAVTIATIYFAMRFIKLKIDYGFIWKTVVFSIPLLFIATLVSRYFAESIVIIISTVIFSFIYYIPIQLYLVKNELLIEIKNKILNYI
jgi:O-antigen/teichoic acid export membrane protein